MDFRTMQAQDLQNLYTRAVARGNLNQAREISEHIEFFGKTVEVVKGRKVPKGTTGECFWLKRYDNSRYGDPWGIYSTTKIGIRDATGQVFFTALDNVIIQPEEKEEPKWKK